MDLDEHLQAPFPTRGPFRQLRQRYRQTLYRWMAKHPEMFVVRYCVGCGGMIFAPAARPDVLFNRTTDHGWHYLGKKNWACQKCI